MKSIAKKMSKERFTKGICTKGKEAQTGEGKANNGNNGQNDHLLTASVPFQTT